MVAFLPLTALADAGYRRIPHLSDSRLEQGRQARPARPISYMGRTRGIPPIGSLRESPHRTRFTVARLALRLDTNSTLPYNAE